MNKQELLKAIAKSISSKHPWKINHLEYLELFKEFPREFIEEKEIYDVLVSKSNSFKLCNLILSQVKIEIKLTLDELILWELSLDKWQEAKNHNIYPIDIKKLL